VDDDDRLRRLSNQAEADREAVARLPRPPAAGGYFVPCRVTSAFAAGTVAVRSYYLVQPLTPTGDVNEGAAVTFDTVEKPFLAANLGTVMPPQGTLVLAFRAGPRWSFRYDG
jgi:hypothetical protein